MVEPFPVQEQTTAVVELPEPEPEQTFEQWVKSVNILLYDDMYPLNEARVIQYAVEGLGLGKNTTDVRNAMGDLLSNMNSATQWDLVIIGTE